MSTHTKQRKNRKSRAQRRCEKNQHVKKQMRLMQDIINGKVQPEKEPKWRAELIRNGAYFAYAAKMAEREDATENVDASVKEFIGIGDPITEEKSTDSHSGISGLTPVTLEVDQ